MEGRREGGREEEREIKVGNVEMSAERWRKWKVEGKGMSVVGWERETTASTIGSAIGILSHTCFRYHHDPY